MEYKRLYVSLEDFEQFEAGLEPWQRVTTEADSPYGLRSLFLPGTNILITVDDSKQG